MIRIAAAALTALVISSSAFAVEFEANDDGLIEFNMPSGNVGCVYVPEGGTPLTNLGMADPSLPATGLSHPMFASSLIQLAKRSD